MMAWLGVTLLLLTPARAQEPDALQRACTGGDTQACTQLLPARSPRWDLLGRACEGGVAQACLALAHASADDHAARRPGGALHWVELACEAGDPTGCDMARTARQPELRVSSEGVSVDGTVQVRFTGGARWDLAHGSTEGQLIRPVFGVLRSIARDQRLGDPDSLAGTLVLRVDPRAPSEVVNSVLYTAGQAGWRHFLVGAIDDPDRDLVEAWLPALAPPNTPHPVLRAAAEARPEGLVIVSPVDSEAVSKALSAGPAGIQACWDRAARIDPLLEGRVVVRFVIAGDGQVSRAEIRSSDLANPAFEACLVRAFEATRLPAPAGGGVALIDYPMDFKPIPKEAP
jgi:TonB family protein